jgi:hypothetical protein
MSTIAKKVQIPNSARIKPYYDSQKIVQNESVLNFFPPNPSKKVTLNNYISNPFPGKEERLIVGLSFELVSKFIRDDSANGIDASKIINGVKDAGVVFTADNDYKQFLRVPIEEHSNFGGTSMKVSEAKAYVNGSYVTNSKRSACLKASNMFRLPDPFKIASNQSIDLEVTFADASVFPTEANWTASDQEQLYLRATLFLAEIDK